MSDTATREPDFASALRSAVRARGLGLESIQRRLAARKVEVSVATLSYWQSGTRHPGRRRSQEVIAHLESILEIPPRSLRVLVQPPRPRGPIPTQALPTDLPAPFTTRAAVRSIAQRVDMRGSRMLTRISQHDTLTIGADRRVVSLRTRTVARADADGVSCLGISQFFDDLDAGTPQLRAICGATVRNLCSDPANRVVAAELHFGRSLRRGETVVLEYETTSDGIGPRDRSYDASCGVAIREFMLQVRFRADDLPSWCERYQTLARESSEGHRHRVPVDAQGNAHTVVLDAPPSTIGLAWEWESPGSNRA